MASTDARPVPQKNVALRVTFPIYDADGDLVPGATGLDSEVSKDGGTFADATSEATEIATASGMYFLDLTATEMNADTVAIIVKTTSVGAKTTALVFYPEEAGDIRVNVTEINDAAVSTASAQLGVNVIQAAGTAWNSGAIGANTLATDTLTAAKIAADAIGASELAADAVTEIQSGLATAAALTTVGSNVSTILAAVDTEVAAILAAVDTEVAAIKAKTDLIPGTQDGKTFSEVLLLIASALLGKASGLGTTTAVFRALDDTQDRITATVDTDGNRSAVTLDVTSP